MSIGVRAFVFIVFGLMSLSFLATTATLAWEFWGSGWLTIANFYSRLFIFFPPFGIVTLIAFYPPACVFFAFTAAVFRGEREPPPRRRQNMFRPGRNMF